MSTMHELMDDDEPVNNGDPMLSSPHALPCESLLSSPSHTEHMESILGEPPRLPTPTSHIDPVDGDTLDIDMIA